ncbi:MAG TPA: PA14 domain-containing protein, partial [Anaerolineae bacterium]|nr:PA14 domain-containing protein [Anaerolineae bacterium]
MKTRKWVQVLLGIVAMLAMVLGGQSYAVAASASLQTGAWFGEYYANTDLVGGPTMTRQDAAIDFSWGTGSPAAGIPTDGFSARWTRTVSLEAGLYRFRATVDDGIRVFLDSVLIIDSWRDGGQRELSADRQVGAGNHTLRVEYYERAGLAVARFRWEKVGTTTTYPDWRGEYWNNVNLSGNPALVRNDPIVNFDWGTAAPAAGISADNFSARWTRTATFTEGLYLFRATVDDGIRVYVDGTLIIDQ